jgi:hypothetical protein
LATSSQDVAMRAVEFITTVHDNVVDLPIEHSVWNGAKVHVIMLEEKDATKCSLTPPFRAVSIKTRNFRLDRDRANARP